MAHPEIDVANARKTLGNLVASIAKGEVDGIVITRYGKPMAMLGPVLIASNIDSARSRGHFDVSGDWKVDEGGAEAKVPRKPKPSGPSTAVELDPPNPEPLEPMRKAGIEYEVVEEHAGPEGERVVDEAKLMSAAVPRPAWKAAGGLSKKEQAGGKYDR